MIDRYTRPEMGHIFSLENKYAVWQEIEILACEAHAEIGESGITKEEAAWFGRPGRMVTVGRRRLTASRKPLREASCSSSSPIAFSAP